jgi:Flp pilus assembly pilin Flp
MVSRVLSRDRTTARLAGDCRGTTIVEYMLILVVVIVVAVGAYKLLATQITKKMGVATAAVGGETPAGGAGGAGGGIAVGGTPPAGEGAGGAGGAGGKGGQGGAGGAGGGQGGQGGAGGAAANNGYSAYDENGHRTDQGGVAGGGQSSEENFSMLGRFAMVAVAVLGIAAAFFAIMKGKHAG